MDVVPTFLQMTAKAATALQHLQCAAAHELDRRLEKCAQRVTMEAMAAAAAVEMVQGALQTRKAQVVAAASHALALSCELLEDAALVADVNVKQLLAATSALTRRCVGATQLCEFAEACAATCSAAVDRGVWLTAEAPRTPDAVLPLHCIFAVDAELTENPDSFAHFGRFWIVPREAAGVLVSQMLPHNRANSKERLFFDEHLLKRVEFECTEVTSKTCVCFVTRTRVSDGDTDAWSARCTSPASDAFGSTLLAIFDLKHHSSLCTGPLYRKLFRMATDQFSEFGDSRWGSEWHSERHANKWRERSTSDHSFPESFPDE